MHFLPLYSRYMSLFYKLLNLIMQIIFVKKNIITNNYESPRHAVSFILMSIPHSSFQIFYSVSVIKNADRTLYFKISACLTTISTCIYINRYLIPLMLIYRAAYTHDNFSKIFNKTASNDKTTVNEKLEKLWEEKVVDDLRDNSCTCHE